MSLPPILPGGYNADDNNADEVDGAGTNWAVWPAFVDHFVGNSVIVLSEDMLNFFVTGCPDVVIAHTPDMVIVPPESDVIEVRKAG